VIRRVFCLCVLAVFSFACAESRSPQTLIEPARSFKADASVLAAPRKLFAVLITHCELLRRNVLHPAIRIDELDKRIELREVSVSDGFTLADFEGSVVSGKEFAQRYGAYITPTVLFLDTAGNSLIEPLIGTGNIEFYSFYLDKKIEAATEALETSQ
jgi:thioredoxin-related protein